MPAAFAKSFLSFPIRVTIGHVGKRIALRAARHLWLVADDAIREPGAIREVGALSEVGAVPMTEATRAENGRAVRRRLDSWIEAYLPVFRALDFDPADLPVGHGREVVAASFDGLVDLCRRELSGIGAVPAPHRAALDHYYSRLVKDESLARAHLGLPPVICSAADPIMSQLLAAVTTLQQQGETTATERGPSGRPGNPRSGHC